MAVGVSLISSSPPVDDVSSSYKAFHTPVSFKASPSVHTKQQYTGCVTAMNQSGSSTFIGALKIDLLPKNPSLQAKPTYANILKAGPTSLVHLQNLEESNHRAAHTLKPITIHEGKPSIAFSFTEKKNLIGKLKFVLIAKSSHGRPPIAIISKFIRNLELKGNVNLSVFDSKHLYVECSKFEDYVMLWSKGVWIISGFPLRMFKWDDAFDPTKESAIVPVWIHLPRLPLFLFDENALLSIANAIGQPLKIDTNNINRTKLGCASVCVELDVSKSLVEEIWLSVCDDSSEKVLMGFWQNVVYGFIPQFCSACAHIGHSETSCLRRLEVKEHQSAIRIEEQAVFGLNSRPPSTVQYKGLINEARDKGLGQGCAVHGCAVQVRAGQGCAVQESAAQMSAADTRQKQNSVLVSAGQTCSGHGFMLCSKCSSEGRLQLGRDHGNSPAGSLVGNAHVVDDQLGEGTVADGNRNGILKPVPSQSAAENAHIAAVSVTGQLHTQPQTLLDEDIKKRADQNQFSKGFKQVDGMLVRTIVQTGVEEESNLLHTKGHAKTGLLHTQSQTGLLQENESGSEELAAEQIKASATAGNTSIGKTESWTELAEEEENVRKKRVDLAEGKEKEAGEILDSFQLQVSSGKQTAADPKDATTLAPTKGSSPSHTQDVNNAFSMFLDRMDRLRDKKPDRNKKGNVISSSLKVLAARSLSPVGRSSEKMSKLRKRIESLKYKEGKAIVLEEETYKALEEYQQQLVSYHREKRQASSPKDSTPIADASHVIEQDRTTRKGRNRNREK